MCAMRTGRQRPKLLLIIVAGFGLAAYARVNLFSHTVRVINRVPGSANEESSLRGGSTDDGDDRLPGGKAALTGAAAGKHVSLQGAPPEQWWKSVKQDPATCGIVDAEKAAVLRSGIRTRAAGCRMSCRKLAGCTGWFWCADAAGCTEWQSRSKVAEGECLLLATDVNPQPEPLLADFTTPDSFFSFQAGYIKDELYKRPPHITVATGIEFCNPEGPDPAHAAWETGDWLNAISIANKQDYARLHGFDFILTAVRSKESWMKESLTKVDLILALLADTKGRDRTDWLLWAEQNALILNPAYSLPLSRYERAGNLIVMYGNPDLTMKGHVNGFDPGVVLMRNTPEVVAFWTAVNDTLHNSAAMKQGMAGLQDLNNQQNYSNYRNAMGILFKDNNRGYLDGLVYFEQSYCISCYYESADLQSPTMFVTHFIDVSHCNDFSLSKDDPRWPLYNDLLLEVYRLARCKHTVALRQASVRALAAPKELGETRGLPEVRLDQHVLVEGAGHRVGSTSQCRAACLANEGCTGWMYCWQTGGCDDGHDTASGQFPEGSCQLYNAPRGALAGTGRGPLFSSSATGFIPGRSAEMSALGIRTTELRTRARHDSVEGEQRRRRLQQRRDALHGDASHGNASKGDASHDGRKYRGELHRGGSRGLNVAVAMAIPDDSCAAPAADHINVLSVSNKQDWAAAHGFEVHLAAGLVDPNVTAGNWNKESMIRKVLADTPRAAAEWILWLDVDTVLPHAGLLPRFSEYEGKDLVVWGDAAKLDAGNMNGGINCGVLLIRNTEWAHTFFADVGQYSYMDKATLDRDVRPVLEKEVHPLLSGFFDTPFIVWLLKTRPEYRAKLFLEDQIGLNRHWLQMDWEGEPFTLITHYAGCTFCRPPMSKIAEPVVTACNAEFYKAYAYGRCTLAELYVNPDTTLGGGSSRSKGATQCVYDSEDLSWVDIRLGE